MKDPRCSNASLNIGARVKQVRMARGMTLAEVGAAVGEVLGEDSWPPQAVWQSENGKRSWRAEHVMAFAIVFDYLPGDLFAELPFPALDTEAEWDEVRKRWSMLAGQFVTALLEDAQRGFVFP